MIELFHSFERVLYHMLIFFQTSTEPLLGANSYWVAIVLMTLTVRAALLPLVVKQVRSARAMRALQPQLQAIRGRHGNNQAKLMEETARLTREHGVNPLAGCLPLLAQAPVFIALSRVIWRPVIDGQPNVLRGHLALGVDLGSSLAAMSWAERLTSPGGLLIVSLIVVAAITTTLTQRLAMAQQPTPLPDAQRRLLQLMPLFFPLMWIGFPLAAIIYWVSSNLWTLGQQWVVSRTNPPLPAVAAAATAPGAATSVGRPPASANAQSQQRKEKRSGKRAGKGGGQGGPARTAGTARQPAASGASARSAPAGKPAPSSPRSSDGTSPRSATSAASAASAASGRSGGGAGSGGGGKRARKRRKGAASRGGAATSDTTPDATTRATPGVTTRATTNAASRTTPGAT